MVPFFFFFLSGIIFSYTADVNRPQATAKTIVDAEECEEVRKLCHSLSEKDDLLVLECLLSTSPEHLISIKQDCQNVIWEHTKNLIQFENVKRYLTPSCRSDLTKLPCSEDYRDDYLKCVVNNIEFIQNLDCKHALSRLQNAAFTDHLWSPEFIKECQEDITSLKCGFIDPHSFSQARTLTCLQNNIFKVKDSCKREISHLSQLQSLNIKLDAQLYVDCSDDQQRYCHQLVTGSGRVFPCLMRQLHMDQSRISTKCRQHLRRREKLIAQDFRISKGLIRACREDIKNSHCRQKTSSEKTVRLAQILLCLEDRMRNGTKVSSECESEIMEHRRMLMDDYRLSPEIVNSCKNETATFCHGFEVGGRTIHCLMNHALNRGSISRQFNLGDSCLRALDDLVKQTNPGENWAVDPVLRQACDPVVKVVCSNAGVGDERVMSCLMDNMRSDTMTEDCENALLEIQYFIARDFKLDPQLYRACKQDAIRHCHLVESREAEQGPSYSREILPCLYRHAYQSEEGLKIQKPCLQQIQRVMRQRAISVDLQPEIEEACVKDLSYHCREKMKKGEEMQCLQDNLEDLDDKCHDVIVSFTEIEAERVDLNPFISKYCNKLIDMLCSNEPDIMMCLIENKNHPQVKLAPSCRASIEHFQLISLKNYKFSYKFKVACKAYVDRLCPRASLISEIISCLSENILNATLQGVKSSIPKECRQQLKAQIFQQREKIDYDPVLKKACLTDINTFCRHVQPGNAQVSLMNRDEKGFSTKCRTIIMHRIMEQNSNNLLNPSLQQNCQLDISKFCKQELLSHNEKEVGDSVIKCLKNKFRLSKLSNACEKEMVEILRERALDINLNPLIRVVCKNELETICKPASTDESGKVEECLKTAFINKDIHTAECRIEVANMIEESHADIQVDPLLERACAIDLLTYCRKIEQGNGRHINCLRTVMESSTQNLSVDCQNKLKERLEMYKNAAQVIQTPEDLGELLHQVTLSPSKNYFTIILFTIVGMIFLIGVYCGRFSKRKYRLLKNK
nr:Golgi apparatus protein 1 [Leptinotarsa decemlineata]